MASERWISTARCSALRDSNVAYGFQTNGCVFVLYMFLKNCNSFDKLLFMYSAPVFSQGETSKKVRASAKVSH